MAKNFFHLRAFIDIAKELKNRGKVADDLALTVNFISPAGDVRFLKGHLADDFKTFKIEGIPGRRLLKYDMGYDTKLKRKSVWAAYNSLTDIDFRQIARPYPVCNISPIELENIAGSNDLHSLLNTDYSMYLIFFMAGGFFFLVAGALLSVIYKILMVILTSSL
jgi:hypothetical protein